MKTVNMPGFTADRSVYARNARYHSVATQAYGSAQQVVIAQIRGGGGFRPGQELGFWRELACAVLCSPLLEDPPLYAACLVECIGLARA